MSINKELVGALANCRELSSGLDDKKLTDWGTDCAKKIMNDLAAIRQDRFLRSTVIAALMCESSVVRNYAGDTDMVAFDAIINRVSDKIQTNRKKITANGSKIASAVHNYANF